MAGWIPPARVAALLLAALITYGGPAAAQTAGQLLAPPARRITEPPAPAAADRPPALLHAPPPKGQPTVTPGGSELTASGATVSPAGLRITKGAGVLPNDHGQVWREYDITPYTRRVRDQSHPEQAIIDWILRETGTNVWFSEPLGILSVSGTALRVYHTPPMQEQVRGIVERFVGGNSEDHALSVRLMTVGSPNWRSRALALLKPVDVKSPGVEAWLLSPENSVQLYEQLQARGDFREHSSPRVEIPNGQSHTLTRSQPRSYTKSLQLKKEFPFYDLISGQIDEGYSLDISPLFALDRQTLEAAITCRVDQVEKLVPLAIDVPIGNQSQRVQIQVPQMASWRLAERFRWPANEVLLLSCGVVASPAPSATGALALLAPLGVSSSRADALLMIAVQPPRAPALAAAPVAPLPAPTVTPSPSAAPAQSVSRGRY
jgi:hypothetical protein